MRVRQVIRILLQLIVGSELRHWLNGGGDDPFAPRFARPGFDLTVDAFPRTANTWTYYQIQLAFPKAKIGHHIHSWQHLLFSKLFGIPTILIVREPDAAVQSLVTKRGGSLALSYLEYVITNSFGRLFADRVFFFDDLTGQAGVTPLTLVVGEILGTRPSEVGPDDVRALMAKRTDHKNSATPTFRTENLGFLARILRRSAARLYSSLEREWRV